MNMAKISEVIDDGLPRALSELRDIGQVVIGSVFGEGGLSVLRKGVTSPEQVRRMQSLLNAFGYNLSVDGIFGPGTEMVLKRVQEKLGMSPTGIYDKSLDERLRAERDNLRASSLRLQATASEQNLVRQTEASVAARRDPNAVLQIAPTVGPATSTQVMTQGGYGSQYLNWLKSKWASLRSSPNFMLYAAGTGAVVIGGIAWFWLRKQGKMLEAGPAQVNGISRRKSKKRKSKKSKK